ncbi:imidazolonepropionase [Halobellus ruber]|uniref:Imidazolonepropionase n=1 Tax=Halobellus ruber TaxID=2761102 RepID=A0A7J9SKI0_9EURY|nr:imidazolonepropionase [Halobellus ruber]
MAEYTVVHDAAQFVRNRDEGLDAVPDAAVVVEDGTVVAAGPSVEVVQEYPPENAAVAINADGKTVLPGFVDPHTHAVFAGDRADEFTAKLQGKTYQEIASEGGGILRTVRAVQETPRKALVRNLLSHLDRMLAHGTTTAEVKSGYGLTVESETKLLEAIREADKRHPIDLVPTFMGAHAVPEGWDTDDYVDHVIEEQLPAVADRGLAEFCDIFCETGIFTVEQSRRVLTAGREYGLTPKIHAEEFERIGGAELAAELGASSADHLLQATPEDAQDLARADVVPVLLPGTAFALDAEYADPEQFAAAGTTVAIATDFNPNCFSQSMEFTVDLACHGMRMDPASALRAATAGAASAVDRPDGPGRLREGDPGDLVIADVPDYEHMPYNFGVSTVETVLKSGEVVHDAR